MDTAAFLELFRQALDNVEEGYYDRSEWSVEAIERRDATSENLWQEIPAKYGERTFCYELYHQVRMLMDQYVRQHSQDASPIRFQAEIKKPQIEDAVAELKGVQVLDKEYFPDFLLHAKRPLDFEHQKLVIEVKSRSRLSFSHMKADLLKIEQFISKYRFEQGLFLAVSTPTEQIRHVLNQDENKKWILENLSKRSQITVMVKEKPNEPLLECNLGQLFQNQADTHVTQLKNKAE